MQSPSLLVTISYYSIPSGMLLIFTHIFCASGRPGA